MNVFSSSMTISTQGLLMTKNVMLCESAIALLLSNLRVLGNTFYCSPDFRGLGETLLPQFEQTLIEKVLVISANLATEDDMPGK